VLKSIRLAEYAELALLFFIQGAAGAIWLVPLSSILDAHGLHGIKPLAFATMALASFVSPLIFGALADRHMSPVKVLRGLAVATAVAIALVSTAIQHEWGAWGVLAFIQLYALCSSPLTSISATIVFERLSDARREYGQIRSLFTLGWMAGCLLVSALNADTSTLAGYSGSAMWLVLAGFTFFLPVVQPPKTVGHLRWHERLGLDALTLLKNPDHRVVFITTALLSIPLAAFYPHTPTHLRALGFQHTSAWMSLGQVSEMFAMFGLGFLLLRWRLKWILLAGIGFAFARFVLYALNGRVPVLLGLSLHGFSYTLVYITAQIYLEQRVDSAWRARAQALMSLMNSGVGSLLGYLGTGWWLFGCTRASGIDWPLFWGGLAAAVGVVGVYFLATYHGRESGTGWTAESARDATENALEQEIGER